VTAFQMATGRLPFDAPDVIDVITMHLHRPPPLPRMFWREIPPQFEALILALLAKDPTQRPALDDVIPRLRERR
jgi:serine/threonine protein kinase